MAAIVWTTSFFYSWYFMHFVFNFYQVHKSQIQILIQCVNPPPFFPPKQNGGEKCSPPEKWEENMISNIIF